MKHPLSHAFLTSFQRLLTSLTHPFIEDGQEKTSQKHRHIKPYSRLNVKSLSFVRIHPGANFPDIDVDRTIAHTAAATGALHTVTVLIDIVFQFVHETLPNTLKFLVSRIVARPVQGEEWKHAGIPVPDSEA